MSNLSKTAAIRKARTYVSKPIGRKTSWAVVGPYRHADLDGPRTSYKYDGYRKALKARGVWVAEIVLVMMGRTDLIDDLRIYAHAVIESASVDELVSEVLRSKAWATSNYSR